MLELPEVLTLSKQANDVLSGKTITQVFNATKPHKFTFYSGDPLEYGKLLVGRRFCRLKDMECCRFLSVGQCDNEYR